MANVPQDQRRQQPPGDMSAAAEKKMRFFFVIFGLAIALIIAIPLVLAVLGRFSGGMLVVVGLGPVLFGALAFGAVKKYL